MHTTRDLRRFRTIENNVTARQTWITCAATDDLRTVLRSRPLVAPNSSCLAHLPLRFWLQGMEASMKSLRVGHRERRGAWESGSRTLGEGRRPPMQSIE